MSRRLAAIRALYRAHDRMESTLIGYERAIPIRRLAAERRHDPMLRRLWSMHDSLERQIIGAESRLPSAIVAKLRGGA